MQQNPNPQQDETARIKTKSKRTRPYTIEARTKGYGDAAAWRDWYSYGRYRTEAEREQALEHYQRVYTTGGWIEFRKGPIDE